MNSLSTVACCNAFSPALSAVTLGIRDPGRLRLSSLGTLPNAASKGGLRTPWEVIFTRPSYESELKEVPFISLLK
jgi:hypothetical protein